VKNPYTTITGYGLIAIAVLQYVIQFAGSHTWPPTWLEGITFLAGLASVFAKDGGH